VSCKLNCSKFFKEGSSEADSLLATQEMPRLFWNPSVHCHATNSPHLVPMLCQTP